MKTRKFLLHTLLAVAVLVVAQPNVVVLAQQQQQQQQDQQYQSTVPGEGDIAIMQKEIKWGMQEMQRYKSIRGAWPVRVPEEDANNNNNGILTKPLEIVRSHRDDKQPQPQHVRGGGTKGGGEENASAHNSYWNLLVSVF